MRPRTLPRISLLLPRSFAPSSSGSSRRLANVNGNATCWRRPTWMPPAPGTCRCRIHGRGTAAAASRAQQLRQQPPKPLNCSSNERPPPASDIIPTAGAKLGPPPPPPPPPQSVRNWSQPTTQGQTPDGHEHKHDKTGDAEADTNPPRAKPPRDTRPSQTYGTTLTRRPQKTSCQPIGAVNGQPRPTIAYLARQSVIPNTIHTHTGGRGKAMAVLPSPSPPPHMCSVAIPCPFPRS
ncbi:uncharacterized protein LY79DRAFT_159228 [Colletotrichum navitas]|uniref:Uncharacterized protein n=1 Tax=Colletotrichum navitas TaxID=681940 RepID=A0AAD8PJH7_9PEZI|nr:uncharacterized protein LY79DRAFT_159228 [Colletotrichum navitas]KAK1564135.1 hypothetical protein LY79DRAFT_159228 [Colletotrichum navitas]